MTAYLPQVLLLLEICSVALVLIYLFLAAKQKPAAWIFGFLASTCSVIFFYKQNYYGSMVLNGIYALQAILGYYQWKWKGADAKPAYRFQLSRHLLLILICILSSSIVCYFLEQFNVTDLIKLDCFLAAASICATFLEIRKDISCWWYWIVCNSVYAILYAIPGKNGSTMYIYSALMAVLAVFSVFAFISWKKSSEIQKNQAQT